MTSTIIINRSIKRFSISVPTYIYYNAPTRFASSGRFEYNEFYLFNIIYNLEYNGGRETNYSFVIKLFYTGAREKTAYFYRTQSSREYRIYVLFNQ